MTLSRRSSRIYLDDLDVDGVISVLDRRAQEQDDSILWGIYAGAARTFSIIRDHDHIETQEDFMVIFESVLKDRRGK